MGQFWAQGSYLLKKQPAPKKCSPKKWPPKSDSVWRVTIRDTHGIIIITIIIIIIINVDDAQTITTVFVKQKIGQFFEAFLFH